MRKIPVFLILIVVAIMALVIYPNLKYWLSARHSEPRLVTARGELAQSEQTVIDIFKSASPSVVFISTSQRRVNPWTRNVFEVPAGTGSGFIWDANGHVVTNYHVIQGVQSATVRLNDDRAYQAALVGYSEEHDLAVLRINVEFDPPEPLAIGSSKDLQVGQTVLAIGNPFGLDYTLTTGVISALNRSLAGNNANIDHLIQTDAAINPGNSGGPLIDSAGRLIGINTAIISPSGAYAGIGFAVPIDTVNRIIPLLISYGHYNRPSLGISADDDLSRQVGERLSVEGILILNITPGSAAEKAGLKGTQFLRNGRMRPGDILLAINGTSITMVDQLLEILDQHSPGDSIELRYRRGDKTLLTQAVLQVPAER